VYADSGFSSIIGQTGLLGTFFYTGFLVLLFFVMVNRFSKNRNARLVVCVWVLFNIVCFFISDSMISNFSIISAFFMAALYLQTDEDKNLKEIKNINQLENDKEGSI
jgi:O-antigen ligase